MTNAATSAVLASTAGFVVPAAGRFGVVRVDDVNAAGYNQASGPFEIIYFSTNTTGTNTLSGFTRAQEGTSAHAFAAGSVWSQVITNGVLATVSNQHSYHVEAWQNGTQGALNNGTNATVAYGTTQSDPNGNFSSSTYTCPLTGRYLVSASVGFSSSNIRMTIQANHSGGDTKRLADGTGAGGFQAGGMAIIRATAGDTITINCANNSGGTVTIIGSQSTQFLQIQYIGLL